MSKKRTLVLAAVMLFALAPVVRGAGFMIYEHGAAAMAMAGAFTSLANNPTALWHNPAGIAWLEGTQIMGGATLIFPHGTADFPDYPGSPSYDQVHKVFYPPHFYLTHKLSKRAAIGLGVFSPYGLGIEWPDPETFPWRYFGTKGDMVTFFVNPAVAFKLTDRLSIGLGVSFIYSKLTQSMTQLFPMGEGTIDVPAEADVNGTSFAFNAGLLYKADKVRLGLNYRSHYTLKYSGTISLDIPVYEEPFEGTGETSFAFPDLVTMGLSFDLTKKLVWAVDLHYIFWSSYDSYTFHLEVPGLALTEDLVVPTKWRDSFIVRTGFEYRTTEKLALRAGIAYDKTPQPASTMDSSLPDANRVFATCGFGYTFGKLTLDVAYHFEDFHKRTSARTDIPALLQGTFKTQAHLLGISLGYKF
jgi:long-chain fatty acid transport protein